MDLSSLSDGVYGDTTKRAQEANETSTAPCGGRRTPLSSTKPFPSSRSPSRPRVSSHDAKKFVRQQHRVQTKDERTQLRSHIRQPHAQQAELQSDDDESHSDESAGTSLQQELCVDMRTTCKDAATWLEQAALQYQELQQSEAQSCKLTSTLASQIKLQKCIEAELREATKLQLDCPLRKDQRRPSPATIEPRVTQGSPWIRTEQLHKSMCALYRDTDAILHKIASSSDLSSTFSCSQTKRCPVSGPIFELKTSAPVPCCIRVLGEMLWRILGGCEQERGKVEVEEGEDVTMEDPAAPDNEVMVEEDSREKWCTVALPTQFGDVQVHCASVVRKFEDAGEADLQRVVFTFASSIAASDNCDLVFREAGWFVLTQCESSSLFQTFYRLQIQNTTSSADSSRSSNVVPPNPDDSYLQEFVMNSLSNRAREHHQQIQDKLLAHVQLGSDGSTPVNAHH